MARDTYFTVPFELGKVVVHTGDDGSVKCIHFDLHDMYEEIRLTSRLGTDLRRYFEGEEVRWDLELDLHGITDFRRAVYERVAWIPYGETATYGEIASDVGRKGGARAVGQAMAANRFPLVIPCHRVISGDRRIGGFSSGVPLKRYLLKLEGVDI